MKKAVNDIYILHVKEKFDEFVCIFLSFVGRAGNLIAQKAEEGKLMIKNCLDFSKVERDESAELIKIKILSV
jgi:hypothetical protein